MDVSSSEMEPSKPAPMRVPLSTARPGFARVFHTAMSTGVRPPDVAWLKK
jgi:hypothetical protein